MEQPASKRQRRESSPVIYCHDECARHVTTGDGDAEHQESPARLAAIAEALQNYARRRDFAPASREALLRVHSARYLDAVTAELTKITLAGNELGEAGTKSICDALKDNKTLKELDLSGQFGRSNIGGSRPLSELLPVRSRPRSRDPRSVGARASGSRPSTAVVQVSSSFWHRIRKNYSSLARPQWNGFGDRRHCQRIATDDSSVRRVSTAMPCASRSRAWAGCGARWYTKACKHI